MGLLLDSVSVIMIVCRFIYLSTILVLLYIFPAMSPASISGRNEIWDCRADEKCIYQDRWVGT